MKIADYYAKVGIDTNRTDIQKVDAYLDSIERKLRSFSNRSRKLMKIDPKGLIDNAALQKSLANSYRLAGQVVPLRITNFQVNQTELNRVINRAMNTAILSANRTVNLNARGTGVPGAGGGGRVGVNTPLGGSASPQGRPYRPGFGVSGVLGFSGLAGGIGLGLAAGYAGRRAFGAVGQSAAMNREIIGSELTTSAVLEAGGASGQGPAAYKWLQNQADRIGFNYLDAAPDYNSLLSNTLGAGLSVNESQDVFLGISEYSRAMGVTPARQKLATNA